MYVVCLLFYAIGGFLVCFYICLSPFPECSEAPSRRGTMVIVSLFSGRDYLHEIISHFLR